MQGASTAQSPLVPVNGYDFARWVLDQEPDRGVEMLLQSAGENESDWLEKKAAVYRSESKDELFRKALENCPPEQRKQKKDRLNLVLLAEIAQAIVAIHNSRGGVLFIGIDDKTNDPVSFEDNDGGGIWRTNGKGDYALKAVLDRLVRENGEFHLDHETLIVPVEAVGVVPKWCRYKDADVLALLIPPLAPEKNPLEVTHVENNSPWKSVPKRAPGDVGQVKKGKKNDAWIGSAAQLADFHHARQEHFLNQVDLAARLKELGLSVPANPFIEISLRPESALGPNSARRVSFRFLRNVFAFFQRHFRLVSLIAAIGLTVSTAAILLVRYHRETLRERAVRVREQEVRTLRLNNALHNEEAPLARLRGILDSLSVPPLPESNGVLVVRKGQTLLASDIATSTTGDVSTVLLDGGTLLFAPPRMELETLAHSWEKRASILHETGDPDATLPSVVYPGKVKDFFFPYQIRLSEEGGSLTIYDESGGMVFITNAVGRALGVESAELSCDGFSFLVLERRLLDPGLLVSGIGSVADFLPSGRYKNRHWFESKAPLLPKDRSVPADVLSNVDRQSIEAFLTANFAMTQGGDFLAFYNALPAAWRKALDESVPALVSKCPDTEYMLFREAALTFYRSYGLHAEWRAETYNTQNLKNGYVKEEVRDAGRRYAAGALAIAEAATADRLLEGNLPALLALPPAGLPGGIGVPPPYTPAKMDFRAEPKPDGSVIVTPSAHPDSVFRMVRVDGVWVSEYWAKCFEGCETWKTRIENVRMTPVRRRWLLKNLIVLKGIAKAGEDASNQSVGLWADSWAVSALKMCRTTFFGDSFRLADWSRVYEFHRLHAAYPKLSPTYGEPEEIDLLDENPAALTTNLYFHPDAESERKTNEAAERERLKRIAETPDEPPPERDSEADAETIGRALLDMPVTNAPAGKN